jgi:hypothetical protein
MESGETPAIAALDVDDEEDYDYASAADPATGMPQVSSYIAIIRIISVLAMGLCVSFGLFLMLAGLKGVLIGIPLVLLAIPCYFGMQLAERLALRAESGAPPAE